MHTTNTQYPLPITQYPSPDPAPSPISPFPIPHSPLLPPGSLTLLLGEPGTGKSLLALDLAARLSRGDSLPSLTTGHCPLTPAPASSIILSREDSLATLRSRLAAANANPAFNSFPDSLLSLKLEPAPFAASQSIPLSSLTKFLLLRLDKIPNPRLLILDPLPAFLGSADSSSASLIRSLLDPLLLVAQHHNLAVLGISHLNKSTHQKNLLHRSLGSLAYTALARAVYLVTPEIPSEDAPAPDPSRRLLIPLKNNLAPTTHARAFNLHITPGHPAPSLLWEPNPFPNPYHQFRDPSSHAPSPFEQSQLDFARDFLQQTLSSGPHPSQKLLQEARSLGIAQRTLNRARFQLAVFSYREPGTGQWLSRLPNQSQPVPVT